MELYGYWTYSTMSIVVSYLHKNLYFPKQISGYAPGILSYLLIKITYV